MSEKITEIYQQNQGKPSFILPLLLILTILSIFGYLYTNVQRKLLQLSWDNDKCNPRYLFFSGFMNPFQKDPWGETEKNFKKCVATNMYKDPVLDKEIKESRVLIKENEKKMNEHLGTGTKKVQGIKKQWEAIKEGGLLDIQVTNSDNTRIFERQGLLHERVTAKTTQMFQVMKSILTYIQGILVLKMGDEKVKLNIDQKHEEIMTRARTNYEFYNRAFDKLRTSNGNYDEAIYNARVAIKEYNKMSEEIDQFINNNLNSMKNITQGCYQLRYNMENESCSVLFPNLNRSMVDYYSTIADKA